MGISTHSLYPFVYLILIFPNTDLRVLGGSAISGSDRIEPTFVDMITGLKESHMTRRMFSGCKVMTLA